MPKKRLLIAALTFLASCSNKMDESTEALCAHMVKLTKQDMKSMSSLELKASCKKVIATAKSVSTEQEFTDYARCVFETDRSADLRDCYAPLKIRDQERAQEERAALKAQIAHLEAEMVLAQTEITRAQEGMDEAFRDLQAAQSKEQQEAARLKRSKAAADLKVQRAKLQAVRDRALMITTQ